MPRVSRVKMGAHRREVVVDDFWHAIVSFKTVKEAAKFLKGFLTLTEVDMLAKRLAVLKLISEGAAYYEIRRELNVSDSTITRLRNKFYLFDEESRRILFKIREEERKRKSRKGKRPPKSPSYLA